MLLEATRALAPIGVLFHITRSHLSDDMGERKLLSPDLVQVTIENILLIRERLKRSQSRHKSYDDNRRRELDFLKVFPMKNVMRFGKKGKLSPRYVKPFEVLEKVGALAYRVALPPKLENNP